LDSDIARPYSPSSLVAYWFTWHSFYLLSDDKETFFSFITWSAWGVLANRLCRSGAV
jgi:hypothetical protein